MSNNTKTVIMLWAVCLMLGFCSCSSRYHLKRALAKEPEIFTEKIQLASKIIPVAIPTPEISISATAPVIVGDTVVTTTETGATITQIFTKDTSGQILSTTKVYVPPDSARAEIEVPVMEIAPADIVAASQSKWKDGLSKALMIIGSAAILILILTKRKRKPRE